MELEQVIRTVDVGLYRYLRRFSHVEEIRVHRGLRTSMVADGQTVLTDIVIGEEKFRSIFAAFCGGSLHTHERSLCQGYIRLGNGFRVGVCGKAVAEDEVVQSVGEVTSLSIRIPYGKEVNAEGLFEAVRCESGARSCLLFSPPGVGKTTALRDLAQRLAGGETGAGGLRVAVIDSRGELSTPMLRSCPLVDLYEGYPKAAGIELATRTMSPQVLCCDEIGGAKEAEAILAAQHTGVPLIATAHAGDIRMLMRRRWLRQLHEEGIFERYGQLIRCGEVLRAEMLTCEEAERIRQEGC